MWDEPEPADDYPASAWAPDDDDAAVDQGVRVPRSLGVRAPTHPFHERMVRAGLSDTLAQEWAPREKPKG
jgi:hypothetical protein